ncbi:hypothetical protein PTTG_04316 [Puccinia triticina 1-1 BBBD Race 1]|uniref:Uncharacterized protein n=1 Tax=Puccinia triticina (isolate 1-1 / race 1 (BBBD)) TaxID=630390 RepID=A0A180GN57_PUCT1|nr:hypothetical protein PTTG_04316 [Puccinia triticina 1-1 BBBD Race 1]
MSGLNIQGISEAVLAQRTPQTQGEETGTQPTLEEPPNPTVEEGVEPESSSQTNGPPAKATKAATKQKGSKPTTRAAAKLSGVSAQKTQTPGGEASREANLDHEIIVALESPKVVEPRADPREPGTEGPPANQTEINRLAKAVLLEKAIKAQNAGEDAKADRFFELYDKIASEISIAPVARPAAEIRLTEASSVTPQKRPVAAEEVTQVRNTRFAWGISNSHDDGGFTPYFHKNLLELKGPLPLTIFNKQWQTDALTWNVKNKPKTNETAEEKGLRYHGLPVPDEMAQSFVDWTLNHRCFYTTIKDRYHYPVLAEWILIHKGHCDRLQRKHGFMVALRYDIRIRNNAFAFRVEKNGEEFFSDISAFKPETYEEVHSETRDLGELNTQENPYTIGQKKFGWNSTTGEKPASKSTVSAPSTQPAPKVAPREHHSGPTQSTASLPQKPGQALAPEGSAYKGRNYIPNYVKPSANKRGTRDQ